MAVRRRVGLGVAWGLAVVLSVARADAPPPDPWESGWADLEKGEADAARTLLRFADRKAEAVAFLAGKMKPLHLDPDRAQLLLAQLASKDKSVWKPAFEELEYFDPRLAVDLEQLMKDVTKSPARQRMVEILSGRSPGSLEGKDVQIRSFDNPDGKSFNFFADNGSWWAERKVARLGTSSWMGDKKKWTRAVRAIVFLEHAGTPEATAVLKEMATGDPDARPTRAAQEALDRMAKGPGPGDRAVTPDLARVGDPALWNFAHAGAEAVEEDGRKAARVTPVRNDPKAAADQPGVAFFSATDFDEGTIEVDLKGSDAGKPGTLGVAFHGIYAEAPEAVVFRPSDFQGGDPGQAVQYVALPTHKAEKLHKESPGKYEAAAKPAPDPAGWFHAKVVVTDRTVSVFLDGAKDPCLVADRLSERAAGSVGFWVEGAPATFANLKITPAP